MANLGPSDSSIHTFTTDWQRWKNLKGFAHENRRQPTLAEAQLWQALRTNQLGSRFRRQHAIEDYIVDFVCLPAWLVVEVDGEVHHLPEQAEYDGGRTLCRSAGSWWCAIAMRRCCTGCLKYWRI
jgi:very-short-patch-repair endonuclease